MDDFYAARSRTIPPLPWSNIAPPFSARLDAILGEIQSCAPAALAATKALLNGLPGLDIVAFSHTAADVFADAVLGEGAEGIAAFKEKRAPAWANT